MHNFYLTRVMEFWHFARVNTATRKQSNTNQSIKLVAVDHMSVDTMTPQDRLNAATREDAAFLFLLKGFTNIDAASSFMDTFMDELE